jgi:uncharacterized hydrophobic protein (TIGR00271 family)
MDDSEPGKEGEKPAGKTGHSRDIARVFATLRKIFREATEIRSDANIEGTIETIHKDMVFRGPNVWVLICSIFICSIGLDTNSTAVIIGAMLISPLMGPILAVGLAIGVNDIPTLRRAIRHFLVMTLFAVATSTIYFLITPLGQAQTELMARVRPTLLDAAIAVFGGLAGIIGVSRRNRGNVIPGVAIATALMPPLCTAGFGIANGEWSYFVGAIYLFALNSVLIASATVFVVRYLEFPFVEFLDETAKRKGHISMTAFVLVILVPSTWLLVGVVKESLFHRRANDFIAQNLQTIPGVDVVRQHLVYSDSTSLIEVVLSGDSIPPGLTRQLEGRIAATRLRNTTLRIRQPENLSGELGRLSGELRVGIIEDLYDRQALLLAERDLRIASLESALYGDTIPVSQIMREVAIQYPLVDHLSFGRVIGVRESGEGEGEGQGQGEREGGPLLDTIPTALIEWRAGSTASQQRSEGARLAEWLKVRLGLDTIRVVQD